VEFTVKVTSANPEKVAASLTLTTEIVFVRTELPVETSDTGPSSRVKVRVRTAVEGFAVLTLVKYRARYRACAAATVATFPDRKVTTSGSVPTPPVKSANAVPLNKTAEPSRVIVAVVEIPSRSSA